MRLYTEEPYVVVLQVQICGEGAGQPVPLPGTPNKIADVLLLFGGFWFKFFASLRVVSCYFVGLNLG